MMELSWAVYFLPLLGLTMATSPFIPPKETPDENTEVNSGQIFGDNNLGPGGRALINDPTKLWPKTDGDFVDICYVLDASFSESDRALINEGARHMNIRTCIRFNECSQEEAQAKPAYLDIKNSDKCASPVGRSLEGALVIYLESSFCLSGDFALGTVLHMFMHSLGFYHEQQRPDRDDHILIHTENICTGKEQEFDIVPTAVTFDIPYDFGSITHFNRFAFSKCDPVGCPDEASNCSSTTEKPTMSIPSRPALNNEIGQREVLSILDIAKIRNGYSCPRPVGPVISSQPNNPSPDAGGGCFPGSGLVWRVLGSGVETVRVSELTTGDQVLAAEPSTGQPVATTLLSFIHRDTSSPFSFMQIRVRGGKRLTVTPNHLMLVVRDGGGVAGKMAAEVRGGDVLLGGDVVVAVERQEERRLGAYAPLTAKGTIIVDGVVASCYANVNSFPLAHWAMYPVRALQALGAGWGEVGMEPYIFTLQAVAEKLQLY